MKQQINKLLQVETTNKRKQKNKCKGRSQCDNLNFSCNNNNNTNHISRCSNKFRIRSKWNTKKSTKSKRTI